MTAPSHPNIAAYLPMMAREIPNQKAVITLPSRRSLTYAELEARSNRCANGFAKVGITREMRVLVMVKPGLDFVAVVFALLKIGALPVLIDPGMGVKNLLGCVRHIKPEALIGISPAQALRFLHPKAFGSVRYAVTVGRRWFWSGPTLESLQAGSGDRFDIPKFASTDPAAILFTSGSTGPPKGVAYEHGMFTAQVESIRSRFGIAKGEVELATFPLFALFAPSLGTTCVFPQMDFSRPGLVDPRRIVRAMLDYQVTTAFGSPALWRRVADYCVEKKVKLPAVRRILIAGAPVRWEIIEQLKNCLAESAKVHTPYGATEALPVSAISGSEILCDCLEATKGGAGTCVGKPLPSQVVKIIRVTEEPIAEWSADLELPQGEIGEIAARGDIVTKSYCDMPTATRQAKIADGAKVWHRMGDLGYFDGEGRLWFCGRKSHRVITRERILYTEPCEAVFNQHASVSQSALVGVGSRGAQKPVMVVECHGHRLPRRNQREQLRSDLIHWAGAHEVTRPIREVLFHRGLPVDVRHNAKINREALAGWAKERLG